MWKLPLKNILTKCFTFFYNKIFKCARVVKAMEVSNDPVSLLLCYVKEVL